MQQCVEVQVLSPAPIKIMDKKEKNNVVNIETIKEAKSIASLSEKINNVPVSILEIVKEIQERPLPKEEH